MPIKDCEVCARTFKADRARQATCSATCREAKKHQMRRVRGTVHGMSPEQFAIAARACDGCRHARPEPRAEFGVDCVAGLAVRCQPRWGAPKLKEVAP